MWLQAWPSVPSGGESAVKTGLAVIVTVRVGLTMLPAELLAFTANE